MSDRPYNSDGYQHEALDRAHVQMETFNEFLLSHPFITHDRELKAKAEAISTRFFNLYQSIGSAETVSDSKESE